MIAAISLLRVLFCRGLGYFRRWTGSDFSSHAQLVADLRPRPTGTGFLGS